GRCPGGEPGSGRVPAAPGGPVRHRAGGRDARRREGRQRTGRAAAAHRSRHRRDPQAALRRCGLVAAANARRASHRPGVPPRCGGVGWWRRLTLVAGIIASAFSSDEVGEDEIEKLKEGDVLEATFAEFAESRADLYGPLIAERDEYMANKLLLAVQGANGPRHQEVLAVVGAGHLKGIKTALEAAAERDPDRAALRSRLTELQTTPPPSRLTKLIPWAILVLVLAGFAVGFLRSP